MYSLAALAALRFFLVWNSTRARNCLKVHNISNLFKLHYRAATDEL